MARQKRRVFLRQKRRFNHVIKITLPGSSEPVVVVSSRHIQFTQTGATSVELHVKPHAPTPVEGSGLEIDKTTGAFLAAKVRETVDGKAKPMDEAARRDRIKSLLAFSELKPGKPKRAPSSAAK
jgi:hypothetical protein